MRRSSKVTIDHTFVDVSLSTMELPGRGFIWMGLDAERLVDGKNFEEEGKVALISSVAALKFTGH